MKSWSYLVSIPAGIAGVIMFWYNLVVTINSGMFDSLIAWILLGLICHGFLIGISYHAYRTLTGTWLDARRKREKRRRDRRNK